MKNRYLIIIMLQITMLVAAFDCSHAATDIVIVPSGPSSYSIITTDLPDSSGMQLFVTYDSKSFNTPQVTSGDMTASAYLVANTDVPGSIVIGIMTGGSIKGTGKLASISFTKTGAAAFPAKLFPKPVVYSVSGSEIPTNPKFSETIIQTEPAATGTTASTGATATVGTGTISTGTVSTSTGSTSTGSTSTGSTSTGSTSTGSTSTGVIYAGTITLPGTQQQEQKVEQKRQEISGDSQPEVRQKETPVAKVEASIPTQESSSDKQVAALPSKWSSIRSVLMRFRNYKGERTVKELAALFDNNEMKASGIVQSPAIVVTDGKALVTVGVDISNVDDSPSFSFKGANLKAIRRVSDKRWEIDALPQKGKSDVRLTILLKGDRAEIPLVAVPPLDKTGVALLSSPESVLDALLLKSAKNGKPSYDLNSDGKQDYVDDYILVAHWLLKKQQNAKESGSKPAAPRK